MGKKLLSGYFFIVLFFLASNIIYGQCATSVGISADTGSEICEGTSVTFTATVNDGSGHNYQWKVEGVDRGGNSGEFTTSNLSNGDVVSVIVTSEDCGEVSDTFTMTVNDVRIGSATITASNTNICPGEIVDFSISSSSNVNSISDYEWRVNGNAAGTNSTFSSDQLGENDQVQLYIASGVPCVEPFLTNTITISEKSGTPTQPGSITSPNLICPGVSEEYSVTAVSNADEYIWTLPNGDTQTTSGPSISFSINSAGNHSLSVQASNECGTSEESTTNITVNDGTPSQPTTISSPTTICPGVENNYSVSAVDGADEYLWIYNGTETTTTASNINITFNSSGDQTISVQAVNECGISSEENIVVSVNPDVPDTPESIQGASAVCPGEEISFSVTLDDTVSEYQWTVPDGWNIMENNGNEILAEAGNHNQNGDISVTAINDCGENSAQSLAVSVNPGIPDEPVISGANDVCTDTEEEYTISPIEQAEEYTWEFPADWQINGSGSNTITVDASITSVTVIPGTSDGSVSVIASNPCGDSTEGTATLNIEDPAPNQPGEVSFPNPDDENKVCQGEAGIYSIAPVAMATEYLWTLPDGSTQTTTQPELNYTANISGTLDLSVQAVNSCGNSPERNFQIEVTDGAPQNLGEITSNLPSYGNNICPPTTGVTFEVPTLENTDYYVWDIPDGWEITAGENSNKITVTVTANAAYNSESVDVQAFNICGGSNTSSFTDIIVGDFIITDLGEDKTVCETTDPININVHAEFGNSKKLTPTFTTSGTGSFSNVPTGNNIPNDYTVVYTPSPDDILQEFITIELEVTEPRGGGQNSACGDGQDELRIYFRDDPTADIFIDEEKETDICTGTATDLTITGTANTVVSYTVNGGTTQEISLDEAGEAIINSGNLTETTTYALESVRYSEDPSCPANLNSSATINVTPIPSATISYSGPYCTSIESTINAPTLEGEHAYEDGTFEADGDLAEHINNTDGTFIPEDVNPGEYTVTYTIPASGGCEAIETTITVSITALPTTEISYGNSPYCSTDESAEVSLSGTNAYENGTFSSTTGLDIDPDTGLINISESTVGTYTVTYTTPEAGGCEETTATTEISITEIPIPKISYSDTEFCKSDTATYQANISGSGEVEGGTFSSSTGLTITPEGEIDPSESDAGTYTITYNLDTEGDGCEEVTAQTEITITEIPSATISYTGPFCKSTTGEKSVEFSDTVGAYEEGTFSATTSGLSINSETGAITPSTSDAGEYTVQYTIPESGGCESQVMETIVIITEVPSATIAYAQTSFCTSDETGYTPEFSDTNGDYETGTFSGSADLEINSETGEIIPSANLPGTYTVTYTIPTADGCEAVTITTEIEIFEEITITTQPFNIGICSGEAAVLEVGASGDELIYQWFNSNGEIDGATSSIYEISPANAEDSDTYYVEVSGASPCSTVTSEEVSLNVDENIIVSTQPEDQELCLGDIAVFEVAATANGGDVVYQWLFNGEEIPNENGETLTLNDLTSDDAGEYSVYIEGPAGYSCSTITSGTATLSLSEPPLADAGENIISCYTNEAIDITTGATAENFSGLEWTHNGTGTINNSETIDQATYTPGEDESGTINLSLTAYGNATCAEIVVEKTLDIEPVPVISSFQYSATEFCETDSELKSPTIIGENAFENGLFSVVPETGLSISEEGEINPSESEPGTYEITYSTPEDAICDPVLSNPVSIVIGENPVADFEYDATVYCKDTRDDGQNTNPVITVAEDHTDAQTFTANIAGLDLNAQTGEIDLSNSDSGTYIITRTVDYSGENEDGCTEVSADFEIIINDKPIPDFEYEATEFCADPENPIIAPILLEDGVLGNFTYTATPEDAGLSINSETGEIDLNASDAGNFTITNTVNYVDDEEDSCESVNAEFSIRINKKSNPAFSYTKEVYCISEGIAAIDSQGFEPGGEFSTPSETLTPYLNTETGEITWDFEDEIQGSFDITYKIEAKGACEAVEHTTSIQIDPLPEAEELSFGGFGRLYKTCEDPETLEALTLQHYEGDRIEWYYRNANQDWQLISGAESAMLSREDIISVLDEETLVFQAKVYSGVCENPALSGTAILSVISSDIEPAPVSVSDELICLGNEVTLSAETGYQSGDGIGDSGNFDNASITNHGWRVQKNGVDQGFNTSASTTRPDIWLRVTPRDFHTASLTPNYNTSLQLFDHGLEDGNKGMGIVSGNNPSTLETPVFAIDGLDEAVLTFDQAYNLTGGAAIAVEISTQGGSPGSYETIFIREADENLGISSGNYDDFAAGTPETRPENKIEIDLGEYMGQNNLRIRFNYMGVRDGDIWTLDNIEVPDGPQNVGIIWEDTTNPETPIVIGTNHSEQWAPTEIGWNVSVITTTLEYTGGSCATATNDEEIKVFVYDQYTSTVQAETGSCGNYSAQLSATLSSETQGEITSYPTEDGYIGKWEVEGPERYEFSNIDPQDETDPINNPNAIFTSESATPENYTITWVLEPTETDENGEIIDNAECLPVYEPAELIFEDCTALDFDGEDDYVDLDENYTANYSLEAWIRPEASTGTIISGPTFEINMEDLPGGIQTNSRWYHIAVSGGNLFIDGIEMGNVPASNGGQRALIGARWNNETKTAENHFTGWIEEVRIWNTTITVDQIRFMMNQRLQNNGTQMGVEIPMDVPDGLSFADLEGYYQLLAQEELLAGGTTPDLAQNAIPGKMKNMETFQENTAPLPYTSRIDGQTWATDDTWTHFEVWDAPNSNGIDGDTPIEWNIVRTSHDIASGNKDITVLGLLSEEKELEIADPGDAMDEYNNGQLLRVTHYLALDGIIDLVGESQLLQDEGSILEEASNGYLERDQQGTRNSYNYNYWSSPVSAQGSTNNAPYSVAGTMRDGTDPLNPRNIDFRSWHAAADQARQSPIIISTYWLHAFNGRANVYGDWQHIGANGTLNTGEGFSMKGTSGTADIDQEQNYVFTGKPHNGNFKLQIGQDMNYLLGNPYPSALDANEFILDNLKDSGGRNDQNIFNGVIYLWDHFGAENTHVLREYVGGYAAYSLSGGVEAISNDNRINDNDARGTKTPERFIPVGQGFFVNTRLDEENSGNISISGGDIIFRNSQRAGIKEGGSSIFLKPENPVKTAKNKTEGDSRPKIRLRFSSPTGYHRQILATLDKNTTNDYDLGYDAPLIENNAEDMYWLIQNKEFVIQGVPNFNEDQVLPLGVKVKDESPYSIKIDTLENYPEDKMLYLRDMANDSIHNLKDSPYETTSTPGKDHKRFEIIFYNENEEPDIPEENLGEVVDIDYYENNRELKITNPKLIAINTIYIFDINGRQIQRFEELPKDVKEFSIQVRSFPSGIYIVKLFSEEGVKNKKIRMR